MKNQSSLKKSSKEKTQRVRAFSSQNKERAFFFDIASLNEKIKACRKCNRLVSYRETVSPKKAFAKDNYFRKPLSGFGDLNARLLICGLAPSSHGGNRTGRLFTGDESGRFLMKALHLAGFSNLAVSESVSDGLILSDCFLTALVRCAPPKNQPLASEYKNCFGYFENEFFFLKKCQAVLALGREAFFSYFHFVKKAASLDLKTPHFSHGAHIPFAGWPDLYGSFHPSPQNTYTKKLTLEMMVNLLQEINNCLK